MIVVDHLRVRVGGFALSDVSFSVPTGAHAVLMGRSGSGKTTMLEALCGLRRADSGTIVLGGTNVTMHPPAVRGVGYVPQDGALFSHLNVRENLAFALCVRRWPVAAIRRRISELASWLGLGSLLERRPSGLSGGEIQRVALGRALAFSPAVLLLDEPLSALDDAGRDDLRGLLRTVRERGGVTVLHVTHHREDARQLADRLFILENGAVTETPLE